LIKRIIGALYDRYCLEDHKSNEDHLRCKNTTELGVVYAPERLSDSPEAIVVSLSDEDKAQLIKAFEEKVPRNLRELQTDSIPQTVASAVYCADQKLAANLPSEMLVEMDDRNGVQQVNEQIDSLYNTQHQLKIKLVRNMKSIHTKIGDCIEQLESDSIPGKLVTLDLLSTVDRDLCMYTTLREICRTIKVVQRRK